MVLEMEKTIQRRQFLSSYLAAATVGAASLPFSRNIGAAGQAKTKDLDPDKFAETAYQCFIPGKRTCSESILMAGCRALGIESNLVPDIALGLAGGIGLQGNTCGILTTSAMVLSLAVAKKETEYAKKKMRTLQAVGRFYNAFKKSFGKTDCRSISGLDLTTPEGRTKLAEGVKLNTCSIFVREGAKLLAKELNNL
jgi:C_GCAxxG_C_C family probable redox protein